MIEILNLSSLVLFNKYAYSEIEFHPCLEREENNRIIEKVGGHQTLF